MQLHVPLKFGCAAVVVVDDTDRPAYVPRPLTREEHADTCQCGACRMTRDLAQPGTKA